MTFKEWYGEVDMAFIRTTGLTRDDFADNMYFDLYEEGMSPVGAMVDTIEREYGEEGLEAFGLEV